MAQTQQRNEQQLLIGGKWVDASEGTYEIVNPATEDIVGLAPNASADDALAAAVAAKEAQPGWAAWSGDERGALMRAAAATRRDHRRHGQSPAARRGGLHHLLQLPHGQHGGQGGPRAGGRQHRRR